MSFAIQCGMINAIIYFLCSIGTALSPNIASFVVFRMLTAFAGTAFLVLGPAGTRFDIKLGGRPLLMVNLQLSETYITQLNEALRWDGFSRAL